MINKETNDYINELYQNSLKSMPTFTDEMIKTINDEISKITEDAKLYYNKRNGIKDDDNTNTKNIVIGNNISEEMNNEFKRMDKEYNL